MPLPINQNAQQALAAYTAARNEHKNQALAANQRAYGAALSGYNRGISAIGSANNRVARGYTDIEKQLTAQAALADRRGLALQKQNEKLGLNVLAQQNQYTNQAVQDLEGQERNALEHLSRNYTAARGHGLEQIISSGMAASPTVRMRMERGLGYDRDLAERGITTDTQRIRSGLLNDIGQRRAATMLDINRGRMSYADTLAQRRFANQQALGQLGLQRLGYQGQQAGALANLYAQRGGALASIAARGADGFQSPSLGEFMQLYRGDQQHGAGPQAQQQPGVGYAGSGGGMAGRPPPSMDLPANHWSRQSPGGGASYNASGYPVGQQAGTGYGTSVGYTYPGTYNTEGGGGSTYPQADYEQNQAQQYAQLEQYYRDQGFST